MIKIPASLVKDDTVFYSDNSKCLVRRLTPSDSETRVFTPINVFFDAATLEFNISEDIVDPSIVRDISPEEIRESLRLKQIRYIQHHRCAICDVYTAYVIQDDGLYYDSSCECACSTAQRRGWEYLSAWVNTQPTLRAKLDVLGRLGLLR